MEIDCGAPCHNCSFATFFVRKSNSTGSLTGTAGADTTAAPTTRALIQQNDQAGDQRVIEGGLFLLNRAENWNSARTTWKMVERLQSAAVKYEEEAMDMAREISEAEFAEKEKQLKLQKEQELRRKLFAEEDARRERVMVTPGPTTTIVATEALINLVSRLGTGLQVSIMSI